MRVIPEGSLKEWVEKLDKHLPATIPMHPALTDGFASVLLTLSLDPPEDCILQGDWNIPLLPIPVYAAVRVHVFGWSFCRFVKIH